MRVVKFYEHLHSIPELGFEEYKTSEFLQSELKKAGFDVKKITETGFYAELGEGDEIIAFRSDIDALGHMVDGKKCAKHTCGHDAHMSMLLESALQAKEQGLGKNKKFRFIFQPAEEIGKGALAMIDGGACNGVSKIFGMHIRPMQECPYPKAVATMYFAASASLEFKIKGLASHGARPHLGINAIDAGVAIIEAARRIYIDPNKPSSIKATRFICDSGVTNSIPSEATLVFDMRAQFNESMEEMKEKIVHAATHAAAANYASIEHKFIIDIPAAVIDEDLAALCEENIKEVLGEENTIKEKYIPGGEDFFFFPLKLNIPAAFMGLGVDCTPGLHHPDMSLNKNALENGVKIWLNLMKKLDK